MKFLVGLGVLQTIAILALILLVARDRADSVRPQPIGENILPNDVRGRDLNASSFDEQRLRSIIREELVAREKASRSVATTDNSAVKTEPDARATADQRIRSERVVQTLESYKSIGTINDQQMQELQEEIGQLDEQSRNQMMRSLMRALNTGALKGRLQ
jgi:hypothetical protein